MNEQIKELLEKRENFTSQIEVLEKTIDLINEEIKEIQDTCQHDFISNEKEVHVDGEKYVFIINECMKCGVEHCC